MPKPPNICDASPCAAVRLTKSDMRRNKSDMCPVKQFDEQPSDQIVCHRLEMCYRRTCERRRRCITRRVKNTHTRTTTKLRQSYTMRRSLLIRLSHKKFTFCGGFSGPEMKRRNTTTIAAGDCVACHERRWNFPMVFCTTCNKLKGTQITI